MILTLNLQEISTEDLKEIQSNIREELEKRQKQLREECEHPEYIRIMYMRPGATYLGCKICHKAQPYNGNR